MPLVGLDTWAVIVALAGAVGILWRVVAAQNEKALADKDRQIAAQLVTIDKLQVKLDEMHNALKETAAAIAQAKSIVESENRKPARR